MTRKKISPSTRYFVMQRDGFACRYCGATSQEATLEVDHVRSIVEGGSHELWNLTTACWACNRGKGSRSAIDRPDSGDVLTDMLVFIQRVILAHGGSCSFYSVLGAIQKCSIAICRHDDPCECDVVVFWHLLSRRYAEVMWMRPKHAHFNAVSPDRQQELLELHGQEIRIADWFINELISRGDMP